MTAPDPPAGPSTAGPSAVPAAGPPRQAIGGAPGAPAVGFEEPALLRAELSGTAPAVPGLGQSANLTDPTGPAGPPAPSITAPAPTASPRALPLAVPTSATGAADAGWSERTDGDTMFLPLSGELLLHLRDQAEPVRLGAGDTFVVPRGTPFRALTERECEYVRYDPCGTVHTERLST
ncbi:cupin domain-containing protein [Streptomyces otsuchiensis]|uniref:cupin domain-containing protein n=1 Tax=Streptomyces otsuchiensis TaxID=2681388 RepID=UPI00102F8F96|nr:cupin domain-containing protein [Streptomyces otsuchiensis]